MFHAALAGIAAASALCGAADAREVRLVMGTLAEVRVADTPAASATLAAAFAALDLVDQEMSLWRDSALARLNRDRAGTAPPALFELLCRSLALSAATRGAFDPTVEPLVRADGHLGEPASVLTPRERAALVGRVGAHRVRLDASRREVALPDGVRLDLGGIAKGWAVDRALDAVAATPRPCALVDLGGSSIGVLGTAVIVDVADPRGRDRAPWASFRLGGGRRALATSSQAERPGHVIDPRDGKPASGALGGTVVSGSATDAEALTKALLVLGEEALDMVEAEGGEGFVLLDGGRPRIVTTASFTERHGLVPSPGIGLSARSARRR